MDCPRCALPLNALNRCESCDGSLTGLSVLNLVCPAGYVRSCLDAVGKTGVKSSRACPKCDQPMTLVTVPDVQPALELDFCLPCQQIWFDSKELARLPKKSREQAEREQMLDSAMRRHRQLESELAAAEKRENVAWTLLALSMLSK